MIQMLEFSDKYLIITILNILDDLVRRYVKWMGKIKEIETSKKPKTKPKWKF